MKYPKIHCQLLYYACYNNLNVREMMMTNYLNNLDNTNNMDQKKEFVTALFKCKNTYECCRLKSKQIGDCETFLDKCIDQSFEMYITQMKAKIKQKKSDNYNEIKTKNESH